MTHDEPIVAANWQRPFFMIWTGQVFSLTGSRVVQFALVWWLTQMTGSATVLATATLVALIPEIAISPIAGAYVDRWNRRRVMIAADVLIALASLWLAAMYWAGATQVWHVYLIMLVRAVGGAFHWPAMQASTSLMVPKRQLARVAGLNQTLNGALNIVGPPLGALLLAMVPYYAVMLVDVGTALLAIVPLLFVKIPQPPREEAGDGRPTLWSDLRAGLRYMWAWPGLVILIGSAMIFKIALTPASSLMPLLVSQHFGGDAAQFSLAEAVLGAGIIAGGLLLSAWGGFPRRIYTTLMGITGVGASLAVLGLAPGEAFWLALASLFAAGLMIPMTDGPIMAILQANVAPEIQGRVLTLMGSMVWITSPLGLAVAGPVSDWLGLQVWYLAAGALCVGIGVTGFFIKPLIQIEENVGG